MHRNLRGFVAILGRHRKKLEISWESEQKYSHAKEAPMHSPSSKKKLPMEWRRKQDDSNFIPGFESRAELQQIILYYSVYVCFWFLLGIHPRGRE